jgi:hypothetical protein
MLRGRIHLPGGQDLRDFGGTADSGTVDPGQGSRGAGSQRRLLRIRKIIQQPEVNTVFEAYSVRPRIVGLSLKLSLN